MSEMKLVNRSGLHPLGQAVLLVPYSPDLYSKNSRIIIPESYEGRLRTIETRGIVLEIGPEAWRGEMAPRAQVGQKVMFSKHAGAAAAGPLDGKQYRVVNADDIFMAMEDNVDVGEILGLYRQKAAAFNYEETGS